MSSNGDSSKSWKIMGHTLANTANYVVTEATVPSYRVVVPLQNRRPYFRLKLFVVPFKYKNCDEIKYTDKVGILEQEEKYKSALSTPQMGDGHDEDDVHDEDDDWAYKYLVQTYKKNIDKQQKIMNDYKKGKTVYFDSGFDLFCPSINDYRYGGEVNVVDHQVCCSMEKVEYDPDSNKEICNPVGYYMYPRSSTGTKTPLALTNSVGIIDSGYRGHLMAALHCVRKPNATHLLSETRAGWSNELFQRMVQVCPPDLSYPTEVMMVNSIEDLGKTERGAGGFGSTGK